MDINAIKKGISAGITHLDVPQLRAVIFEAQSRINGLEASSRSITGLPVKADFRAGDLVEFYSTRKSRNVRLIVDKINTKTLGGHEFDDPKKLWRVPPHMCRLVGADGPAKFIAPEIKPVTSAAAAPSAPLVSGAMPTAANAGGW